MQTQKFLVALGVATLGVVSVATTAEAVTFTTLPSFPSVGYENVFQAEGRYGDNSASPVFSSTSSEQRVRGRGEINAAGDYLGPTYGPIANERTWARNSNIKLTLAYTYNASTGKYSIDYKVGNSRQQILNVLPSDGIGGPFSSILFRTDADKNSSVALTNIKFTGQSGTGSITSSVGNVSATDTDFLLATNFNSTQSFNLSADLRFNWGSPIPGANKLRYQINVGRVIPTPALLPAIIGFGVAAWRKRNSQDQVEA